jgi:hypothetical protein
MFQKSVHVGVLVFAVVGSVFVPSLIEVLVLWLLVMKAKIDYCNFQ